MTSTFIEMQIDVSELNNAPVGRDPNAELRQLIQQSGLTSAVAMTIFNRGLGAAACPASQWEGFLAEPSSSKFMPLPSELLVHALTQFKSFSALPQRQTTAAFRSVEL